MDVVSDFARDFVTSLATDMANVDLPEAGMPAMPMRRRLLEGILDVDQLEPPDKRSFCCTHLDGR